MWHVRIGISNSRRFVSGLLPWVEAEFAER